MKRFQDENKFLGSFGDEIDIKCPKCHSNAVVKRVYESQYSSQDKRVLECKHCYFSQSERTVKYSVTVSTYCCNNVDKMEYESQIVNKKPETIRLKCPVCGEFKNHKPKIKEVEYCFYIDNGTEREKWFGTELWYQTAFGNAIFWAYNKPHIEYMEKYIEADLRERNSEIACSSTLVARLPKFVKEAKNREKLLKVIKKWKK